MTPTDRLFLSELIRGLPWIAGAWALSFSLAFWLRFECWPWEVL